jgi:hypothetical protein
MWSSLGHPSWSWACWRHGPRSGRGVLWPRGRSPWRGRRTCRRPRAGESPTWVWGQGSWWADAILADTVELARTPGERRRRRRSPTDPSRRCDRRTWHCAIGWAAAWTLGGRSSNPEWSTGDLAGPAALGMPVRATGDLLRPGADNAPSPLHLRGCSALAADRRGRDLHLSRFQQTTTTESREMV